MSGDERDKSFADSMRDVKPLPGRDKLRPRPDTGAVPVPGDARSRARGFVVERSGDDVQARAEDLSRKQLAALRTGRIPAERELDLHGLDAAAARRALFSAIEAARTDSLRCLLVIHGLGRRSQQGPVLKRSLPDWLQEEPVAGAILAFATAPANQGGAGGTLVLLRRDRA